MVLEVDPPDCAHCDGLPETASSGLVTHGPVRAVQEPSEEGQELEVTGHDGELSSASNSAWPGFVKKWFTGTRKGYHDDRNSLLAFETRQYLPTTRRPFVAETTQSINIPKDIHVYLPSSIVM